MAAAFFRYGWDGTYTFDKALQAAGIEHVPIPPRTPRHNGKVERSHRDREKFSGVDELNEKLKKHLDRSNRKVMRTLGSKSPIELLREKPAAA